MNTPASIRQARRLAEKQRVFRGYPNVIGTGIGYRRKAGKRTDEIVLIVYVSRKLAPHQLNKAELVPRDVLGVATDVQQYVVRIPNPRDVAPRGEDPATYRPAPGGCSVGHYRITAGTLGTWATRGGMNVLLSNNHVLADCNLGAVGDQILQPGPYDGGKFPIANLLEYAEIIFDGDSPELPTECPVGGSVVELFNLVAESLGRKTRLKAYVPAQAAVNYVDAALAKAADLSLVDHSILDIGAIDPVPVEADLGMVVRKRGRTTRLTNGEVVALDVSVQVSGYQDTRTATFEDQIVIESGGGKTEFSAGGDSGSLILSGNKPVGLLFAGGEGDDGSLVTIGNRIQRVLEAFPGLSF